MGKHSDVAREEAREMVARLVKLQAEHMVTAIKDKTAADVVEAFEKPLSEAPLWAHAVVRMSASAVKAEQTHPGTTITGLNVVLVQPAADTAEFLRMAEPFKRAAIEAQAAAPPPPKDEK